MRCTRRNKSYVSTLPWRQGRRRSAQLCRCGGKAGKGCARSADLERALSTAPTMRGRPAEEADDEGGGDSGAGLGRSAAIPFGRGGSAGAASLPGVAVRGGQGGGLAASRGRGPAPTRDDPACCTSVMRVVARCPGAMLMPMAVVRRCGSTAATGTACWACCWATRSTVVAGEGCAMRGLAEAGGGIGGDSGRLQASGSL